MSRGRYLPPRTGCALWTGTRYPAPPEPALALTAPRSRAAMTAATA